VVALGSKPVILLIDGNKSNVGGVEQLNREIVCSGLTNSFTWIRGNFLDATRHLFCYSNIDYPAVIIIDVAFSWKNLGLVISLKLLSWTNRMLYQKRCVFVSREHHYSQGFVTHRVSSKARFYTLLRLAYGMMDQVIAISDSQKVWMIHSKLSTDEKVTVIHHAIDVAQFIELAPPCPNDCVILGAIGRLVPQKGFDLLAEAWSQRPVSDRLMLLLAGSGPEDFNLRAKLANRSDVQLIGEVHDRAAFYQKCDAILIPSRYEPFGQIGLEARASARPILASAVDGLVQQVEASDCGLLFESSNVDALRKAIDDFAEIILQDPETYVEWCGNARVSSQNATEIYHLELGSFFEACIESSEILLNRETTRNEG
jgi:glycosyltransferase involved in cell wall biosynthesis